MRNQCGGAVQIEIHGIVLIHKHIYGCTPLTRPPPPRAGGTRVRRSLRNSARRPWGTRSTGRCPMSLYLKHLKYISSPLWVIIFIYREIRWFCTGRGSVYDKLKHMRTEYRAGGPPAEDKEDECSYPVVLRRPAPNSGHSGATYPCA